MDFAKMRRIMVDSQIRPNDVTDPEIVSAFLHTPREAFVPKSEQSIAYAEYEIETSEGRALWTPRDIGKMIKSLEPEPSDIALVIGAGAGYETAILSRLCETVIALEESDELVDELTARFGTLGLDRAVAVQGDLRRPSRPGAVRHHPRLRPDRRGAGDLVHPAGRRWPSWRRCPAWP